MPQGSCSPSPPGCAATFVPQAYPTRCCPNSYTCAAPPNSNGLIGCCPTGNSCGGVVNVQSVTTITLQASQQTDVVYVQPPPTTAVVYANPQSTDTGPYKGFCSTLTANGPGLPTTTEGDCGTILIVSGAAIKLIMGYGICASVFFLHMILGKMLHWI